MEQRRRDFLGVLTLVLRRLRAVLNDMLAKDHRPIWGRGVAFHGRERRERGILHRPHPLRTPLAPRVTFAELDAIEEDACERSEFDAAMQLDAIAPAEGSSLGLTNVSLTPDLDVEAETEN